MTPGGTNPGAPGAGDAAANNITGFTYGSQNTSGNFQPDYDVTGLTGLTIQEFISILTDSLGSYARFVGLFDGDTTVNGSNQADVLEVGAGNDLVKAKGGDDILHKWGAGDVDYRGGGGSDTLSFQAFTGNIYPNGFTQQAVVDLSAGTGVNPYGGSLTLTSVENIVGTSQADILTGNNKANVFGDGRFDDGADIIVAKGGDDTVKLTPLSAGVSANGGAGTDTLFFQYSHSFGQVNRLDLQNQANNTGIFAAGTFRKFEVFEVGTDFLPNNASLEFQGDGATNRVILQFGLATVDLAGGDDTLTVSHSSSTIVATGGNGNDTLFFKHGFAGGNLLDLGNQANNAGIFANSTFTGFETFTAITDSPLTFRGDGNSQTVTGAKFVDDIRLAGGNDRASGLDGADNIRGGAGADILFGNTGNDTVKGNGGADRLSGGKDDDVLAGGAGGDDLLGGKGDDTLRGQAGKDTLNGGAGQDDLFGNTGIDRFVFNDIADSPPGAANRDTIHDLAAGELIDVSAIDADETAAGNQSFVLDMGGAFVAGEIRQVVSGSDLILQFNTDADAAVEMAILVLNTGPLGAGSFVL